MADQNGTFALFKKIKNLIDSEIDDRTRSFCRTRKMTVTTAYDAGTQLVGVSEAVGKEIKLPVFGSVDVSKLTVGTAVWVFAPYSSMSNAMVFMLGDGETGYSANAGELGGKPPQYYIQPFNMLGNSKFQVNQRGQSSYTGTGIYTVDLWKIAIREGKITVVDNGITFTNLSSSGASYLEQRVYSNRFVVGDSYSMGAMIDGNLICGNFIYNGETSGSTIIASDGAMLRVYFDDDLLIFRIGFEAPNIQHQVEWVVVCPGAYTKNDFPPFTPRHYFEDFLECQGYLFRINSSGWCIVANGVSNGSNLRICVPLPVPFFGDKTPSIDYSNVDIYPYVAGESISVSQITLDVFPTTRNEATLMLAHSSSELSAKDVAACRIRGNGYLSVSCEP